MIIKENIAGYNVRIDIDGEMELPELNKFRYDFRCEPDMRVSISGEEIKAYMAKRGHMKKETAVEELALGKFGAGLPKLDSFCIKAQKAEKDGATWLVLSPDKKGEWFVVTRSKEGNYTIFTTPWSHDTSDSYELSCVLIASASDGGEVEENIFLENMLKATKRPSGEEGFGKLVGIFGHMFKNLTIKKWRLME